jgi:pimeloyl-ACP methyl ester carboxylesterase
MVWLHAMGGFRPDDPLVERLAMNHAVIAPVAPGFRDTAELRPLRDVRDLAMHYDDLFDALGLEQATVVGYSYGGMIAAELAAQHPHRVARLVLIAPQGLWDDDEPAVDLFGVTLAERDELVFGGGIGIARPAPVVPTDEEAEQLARALTSVAKFVWPLPDKGLRRRLYRVTAETLVLWGEGDRVVPLSYASMLEQGIADARIVQVAGAGHALTVDAPDAAFAAIEEFLTASRNGSRVRS